MPDPDLAATGGPTSSLGTPTEFLDAFDALKKAILDGVARFRALKGHDFGQPSPDAAMLYDTLFSATLMAAMVPVAIDDLMESFKRRTFHMPPAQEAALMDGVSRVAFAFREYMRTEFMPDVNALADKVRQVAREVLTCSPM
jgi:hypothetical protein